jgi:hypothetical protein
MSVQHERLIELCNELRLGGIAAQYPALAQSAAEKRTSFTDFLEELLVAERESRRDCPRQLWRRSCDSFDASSTGLLRRSSVRDSWRLRSIRQNGKHAASWQLGTS